MFPNPQDALPLPTHPNPEQYKKLAKDLLKAAKSGGSQSLHGWAVHWVESLVKLSDISISREMPVRVNRWTDQVEEFARRKLRSEATPSLADAQFVIARSHGFESWPKFAKHIDEMVDASKTSNFEAAADAIVNGDAATLRHLLNIDPALIGARSAREHRATLLHYVSANGVEGYRQKTPENIVQIAKILLQAGAEVDAEADVYGGGCTTLGLTATSIHPERAGVQNELIETLLRHGASMDQHNSAGNQQSLVSACFANGRGSAAEFLAEKGAPLDLEAAAGVGRLETVKSFFEEHGNLRPSATKLQLERGFA